MRYFWISLVLSLLLGMTSQNAGPSTRPEEEPWVPEWVPFDDVAALGQRNGEGQATVADGRFRVAGNLPTLDTTMHILLAAPKTWEGKWPVHARFVFDFPYKPYLRAGRVSIETNLPSIPATARIDSETRASLRPRSNLLLEYELLASAYHPAEEQPVNVTFMVRARLVFLYDDADLGYGAGPDENRPTWLKGTPVVAPRGEASKAVRRIETRPAFRCRWSYAIIQAPEGFQEWFSRETMHGDRMSGPQTLCLVQGCYEEPTAEWGNDIRRPRPEPEPERAPGATSGVPWRIRDSVARPVGGGHASGVNYPEIHPPREVAHRPYSDPAAYTSGGTL